MTSSSPASSSKRTPVRLRELQATDRAPLEAILRATGSFPENEITVALELIDESLAKTAVKAAPLPDDYRFLVALPARAVVDSAVAEAAVQRTAPVIGYVCWGQNPMSDGVFDLYWIAVDPTLQGGGTGQALMAAAEADVAARGGRMILVETGGKASYAPTRRFYQRIGYVEIARLPDFFRPGDDKVIYARRLDGVALQHRSDESSGSMATEAPRVL